MPISQKSLHVMLHLFLVYISWGSTYIGYKFSLGVAGPFLVGAAAWSSAASSWHCS